MDLQPLPQRKLQRRRRVVRLFFFKHVVFLFLLGVLQLLRGEQHHNPRFLLLRLVGRLYLGARRRRSVSSGRRRVFVRERFRGLHVAELEHPLQQPERRHRQGGQLGLARVLHGELRPVEMGVMKLADPSTALEGIQLPDGKAGVSFTCPSSCTDEYFEVEEVTIFSHFLHMHENGQRAITRQYRNDTSGNEVLVHSAEVEYYSFLQAGGFVVLTNESATIQKGDRFETECFYDTALSSVGSDNVTFGLGSENKMCIDFVFYYPNQRIPDSGACGLDGEEACEGFINEVYLLDAEHDFNRTFGKVETCTTSLAEDGEDTDDADEEVGDAEDADGVGVVDDDDGAEDAEEGDASSASSARASVPGLGVFVFSGTAALVVVGITLTSGIHLG